MKQKKIILFGKTQEATLRDLKSEEGKKAFEQHERQAIAAGEKMIKKTMVDYYSMKVPFNSI